MLPTSPRQLSLIQFGRSAAFVLPICHVNTSSQFYVRFGRVHGDQIQLRELMRDSPSCLIIHSRNDRKRLINESIRLVRLSSRKAALPFVTVSVLQFV